MGLFARARSLSRPGKSLEGLLHRSRALLERLIRSTPPREPLASAPVPQDLFASARPAPKPPARIPDPDELAYRISTIPEGFAAPVLLFSLLTGELDLQRAALLLYDPVRLVFASWLAVGFDTTTRHRLRLAPGANEAFNRAAAGEVTLVTGEELSPFRELFSTREYASLRELHLVPFVHNQRLAGLLLIARMGLPSSEQLLALLQAVSRQAAPLVYQAREKAGRPLSVEEASSPEAPLAEQVQSLLQSCRSKGHPLILMRISLKEIIGLMREKHPELDPFRLREDLSAQCASLFRVIGRVQALRPERLLLAIHGMKEADPALLLRQLQAFLLAYLHDLIDSPSLNLLHEVRIVSDDPQEALSFIAELP